MIDDFKDTECPACACQRKFLPRQAIFHIEICDDPTGYKYIAKMNFCDACGLLYAYKMIKGQMTSLDMKK